MSNIFRRLVGTVTLVAATACSYAQYTYFKPLEGFGIEISLSNTTLTRMPIYRNAVASLAVVGDDIIGGTTANEGLTPFVFVASLAKRDLVALKDLDEVVKGQRSIQTGFFKAADKSLYAGTVANKLPNGKPGNGHLIRVTNNAQSGISISDLGVPVNGESVYALTGNTTTSVLYGMTYPSGIFFSYDLKSKAVKTYDAVKYTKAHLDVVEREFHMKPADYLCSALAVDDNGIVYGSQPINQLFSFNPANETFKTISDLPEVWGRRSLGRVESFTKTKQGLIYGGNAGDGQLFEVNPATGKVKNLGKPIMMNRLRGLCQGADGKLYGLAGALPGYAHLFSYDPAGEGFKDMGNPQFILKAPGISQGIEWRGFQLQTITASEDGKYIVMGEDEALSQLLIFPVGE